MAAPLVAGAAGMLWSFNPALSTERVREVLEQTADDLVDPWNDGSSLPGRDTISGWGRINVGRAFASLQAPSIRLTTPIEGSIVSGAVAVGTATTGGYAGRIEVYLGAGILPEEWVLIYENDAGGDRDTLFTWDSSSRVGYFRLRLVSTNGVDEVGFRVVNGSAAFMTAPVNGQPVKYLVRIEGSVYAADYDSVVISYRHEARPVFQQVFSGSELYFGGRICEWPLFHLEPGDYIVRLASYRQAGIDLDSVKVTVVSTMRPGFPIHLSGYAAISPAVADIDGDGFQEIIVGCQDGLFAFNHDGTPLEGFPVQGGKSMKSIPAIDDVDGDGLPDIIAIGENTAACYNYRGEALSGWPRSASTGIVFSSFPFPVSTELFDQEDSVVLYFSALGEVHAYKYNGDPYFYSLGGLFTALDPNLFDTADASGLLLPPFVTATDLDQNGSIEVVGLFSSRSLSGTHIWNGRNGLPLPGWSTPLAREYQKIHGGMLADVNDDGILEVVVSAVDTNGVFMLSVSAFGRDELPGWPVQFPELNEQWLGVAPTCVDIDGDSAKEILAPFFTLGVGYLYAFNHDGTPYLGGREGLPGLLVETGTSLSNVIVADIDGNGVPNLICRGGSIFPGEGIYEQIFAWEPDGTPVPDYPIIAWTSFVTASPISPVISDLDGDGLTEMVMVGDDADLFVWDLKTPYDPDLSIWPKYLGDAGNSGINRHRGNLNDVDDEPAGIPDRFAILENHPNPFNPATTIVFSLDRADDIRLEVFNVLGQKVATLVAGRYPAGIHRSTWDGRDETGHDVATGVYFARLAGDNRYATRKLMLIR
jgi:hypothetical protein